MFTASQIEHQNKETEEEIVVIVKLEGDNELE